MNRIVLHSQLKIQQCYVRDIRNGIQRLQERTSKSGLSKWITTDYLGRMGHSEWPSADSVCRAHSKRLKNGTIIMKISAKQRNERWLKYGTIQSVPNCKIYKKQINISFFITKLILYLQENKSEPFEYIKNSLLLINDIVALFHIRI